MNFDFLRSATASSSAYRVVCGEMIIDSNMWNVHNEVLVAVVRDGYMTVEMGADTYSLSTGDIYFISPNQRYKINNTGNARVDVILLNLSNPASLTQEFIPQNYGIYQQQLLRQHHSRYNSSDNRSQPLLCVASL